MQDGNEFASVRCSRAILERLALENAGPSRKIRSFTREQGSAFFREESGGEGLRLKDRNV